jgi:hypothetical protein
MSAHDHVLGTMHKAMTGSYPSPRTPPTKPQRDEGPWRILFIVSAIVGIVACGFAVGTYIHSRQLTSSLERTVARFVSETDNLTTSFSRQEQQLSSLRDEVRRAVQTRANVV